MNSEVETTAFARMIYKRCIANVRRRYTVHLRERQRGRAGEETEGEGVVPRSAMGIICPPLPPHRTMVKEERKEVTLSLIVAVACPIHRHL